MQKAGQLHARRMRDIRPFVNFDYDLRKPLSAAAQRKILKYWRVVDSLKARNHIVYRPRNKHNLLPAQKFAQHEELLPGITAAFIPVADPKSARLKIGRGKRLRFKIRERGVERESLPFNARKLARDPDGHIAETLAKEPKATHFAVQAGKFEISAAITRERVAPRVKQLMERYSPGSKEYKQYRHSSNHWKEWLHGLNVYRFPDQAEPGEFMQRKMEAARQLKKRRRKAKRATRRK